MQKGDDRHTESYENENALDLNSPRKMSSILANAEEEDKLAE
jgi:hypothetical protein